MEYKFVLTLSGTHVHCEISLSKLKYILNRFRNILASAKNEEIVQLITEKSDLLKKKLVEIMKIYLFL